MVVGCFGIGPNSKIFQTFAITRLAHNPLIFGGSQWKSNPLLSGFNRMRDLYAMEPLNALNLDNKKPLRASLPRGFTNLVLNNKARHHSTESSSKAKVVYADVHFYILICFCSYYTLWNLI